MGERMVMSEAAHSGRRASDYIVFFFSSRRRHTRLQGDWSSDVCSSDLILRWCEETGEVSVFRSPSNYSNGNSRDRQGRLLTCEHDTRRLTRTEYDGTIKIGRASCRERV